MANDLSTRLIFAIAVTFSAFQIWTAAFSPLSSLIVRSVHVGFLLLLIFAMQARQDQQRSTARMVLDWGIGLAAFVLSFYHWVFEADLIQRAGAPNTLDLAVGVVAVGLVFEGARRAMGMALPLICGLFLTYALFGEYLPAPLDHRGYGFDQVIEQMYLGTEGIYGIPTYVSATYIFLFILFGTFLEQAGMVKLFTDVALGTVGHRRGGPAKVSVVSSGLMGTINGSGVANVVTTGQFTIPLMKKFGYQPAFAGAVEATASMGGQIMPPVMGAVAFIMAETLDISYLAVIQAAIVPALLYFATVFWMVHLEAGRLGLRGLAKEACPNAGEALRANWYLLLPLMVLVYLLFSGYTPLFAGTVGLALTVVLILATPMARAVGTTAMRVVFWIVIGLAAAAFFRYGIAACLWLVAALVAANYFAKMGDRAVLRLALNSLAEGAKHAVGVGIACALVGVIIGVSTLTGVATHFAGVIIQLGEHSLLLSLFLTMLACLVLGMGIPTIPNYIITSSLAAPALLELGVPLLISHLFVFYFGIMADLTPPVALAAFAASPIARVSGMKIGLNCMRVAVAGFVIPYMAVYSPALMLQESSLVAVFYILLKASIAITLWGAAAIGYLFTPMSWVERLLAAAAAFALVTALPITDQIGFALTALAMGWHWFRGRRAASIA